MLHYLGGGGTTPEQDPLGKFFEKPFLQPALDLKASFADATKEIGKMDAEMSKVVKTMGLGTGLSLQLKQNFNESYQSIVDLGGKFEDVVGQQEALFDVTGRNLILISDQAKELFAATSVTGLKAEELQKSFYDAGMEGVHIAENILQIVETSNQLGVNARTVSKVVTDNIDKLNRFGFTNGVEGLAKMAGRAAALRFDVSETFELAEDLMSPDKAIEIAAAVQRLGGAATALTDPLRLMDLAQNDVEGLQQELGKLSKQYTYFNEETKSFQIMPGARRQLNEVASALGIDRKEFEKMAIETAKLEKKMSEITFPSLDITDEDKEKLANLAQLTEVGGKKEYVVNFKDESGEIATKKLSDINSAAELALITAQTAAETTGTDPQEKLIQIAESQLGAFGRLAAANERIANTIPMTMAASRGGERILDRAADFSEEFSKSVRTNFGPKSDFKVAMDTFGSDATKISGGLAGLVSGDIPKVIDGFVQGGVTLSASLTKFVTDLGAIILTGKNPNAIIPDGFYTPNSESVSINDGFRQPVNQPVGDSLKTPQGTYDIYEKDYFLTATELPKVLQLSSEKGMKKVLDDKMGDISSIISGALKSANVNNTNTNTSPPKQEVVHTVNFKVSVDGPKNKLSDMLIEELPKNPALMQYIIKHFKDTKSSGGYT